MRLSLWGERPTSFLIRIQRVEGGVRGQVVAVATGMSRLFGDLREAMIFIEEQVQEGGESSSSNAGGRRRRRC